MSRKPAVKRRDFVKLCASAVAAVNASPQVLAQSNQILHSYNRVKLTGSLGRPIRLADLEEGETYLFQYPYVSTPCFLLNLGQATTHEVNLKTKSGTSYLWRGGVGPKRSVVAFSAICAHRMSHPARSVSFINYRHQTVSFKDENMEVTRRPQVISCCSEKSVYDATQGARVLGGPAPQPLATILLEYDESEEALYAVGTFGGEMFDEYFKKFDHRLVLEYRTYDVRDFVADTSSVVPLTQRCRRQILC